MTTRALPSFGAWLKSNAAVIGVALSLFTAVAAPLVNEIRRVDRIDFRLTDHLTSPGTPQTVDQLARQRQSIEDLRSEISALRQSEQDTRAEVHAVREILDSRLRSER